MGVWSVVVDRLSSRCLDPLTPDLKLLAIAFIAVLILGFVGFDFYANRQSQSVDIGPEVLSELRALQQGP